MLLILHNHESYTCVSIKSYIIKARNILLKNSFNLKLMNRLQFGNSLAQLLASALSRILPTLVSLGFEVGAYAYENSRI